ncbi:unnamed protein product [Notodromas monacha]|uniref:Translation initiation factor eIF2B subunit epsilon n=1 Tax=Notodromas monacha TaxID=399045 RepID=A0A7R9BGB2_9CRUS|nr:unnamed protein product [Notodromas monacha]CAG0914953.1 unnamed protein product [Notodromas monacha]
MMNHILLEANSIATPVSAALDAITGFVDQGVVMDSDESRLAVILCDTFEARFGPLSTGNPKIMFPFGPKVFLEHLIDCLSYAGVNHAILLCPSAHGEEVIRSIINARQEKYQQMKIELIVTGDCATFGDAMRDLDGRKIVTRNDFLLFRADALANLSASDLLSRHKINFKQDKGALMTIVFTEQPPCPRASVNPSIYMLEKDTSKVLHFETLGTATKCNLPLPANDVVLRSDLHESGVYICGPGVPPAFSDNFDFQSMGDFVKGILNNEEILGNSLYAYVSEKPGSAAACLKDPPAWLEIFSDMAGRKFMPLGFETQSDAWNVYRNGKTKLDHETKLVKNVFLADGSTIGHKTCVDSSYVAEETVIGSHCVIRNSHIWKKVTVGSHSTLINCIVGENSVIGDGICCENCIIGPQVVLKQKPEAGDALVFKNLRIYHGRKGKEDPNSEKNNSLLGKLTQDSYAVVFDDDRETEDDTSLWENAWNRKPAEETLLLPESDENVNSDEDDSSTSDVNELIEDDDDGLHHFELEVGESLQRGMEESISVDSLVLEINSSKHAYNVGFGDLVRITTLEVLSRSRPEVNQKSVKSVMGKLWGEFAVAEPSFRGEPMMFVLNVLYNKEVLTEDGIIKWYKKQPLDSTVGGDIRSKVKRFVVWLETAESESGSSGSESEDSDEMTAGEKLFTIDTVNADHKDVIHDVAYNFYGNRMATCSSDQQVKVWDRNEDGRWECSAVWKAHNGSVWKVTWAHPEFGQILATCSFDRMVSVWEEIRTDHLEASSSHWVKRTNLVDSRTEVTDIKFAPRHLGLQLAAASADGFVRVYDAPDIMNLAQWTLSTEINCKMSVSDLCPVLAMIAVGSDALSTTGSTSSRVFIYEWNEASRQWIRGDSLPVDTPVHDLAFACQSGRSYHLLAVASAELRLFSLAPVISRSESTTSGASQSNCASSSNSPSKFEVRLLLESKDHSPAAWRVSWNCSGSILSSAGDDGTVRLWKGQPSGPWSCILALKSDGRMAKEDSGQGQSDALVRGAADSGLASLNAAGVAATFYKLGGVFLRILLSLSKDE